MDARDGARFDRACEELLRSVSQLRAGQSYYVFLFCWNTENMFRDRSAECVKVTAGHEEKLRRWISGVSLGAGTDPRRALALARQMKPDAVFLLSDGHFNRPGTPLSETGWIDEQGNQLRKLDVQEGVERFFHDIPIHTIALENPFTYAAMEQIAKATGGSYRYIKTGSQEPIDAKRFLSALRHIDQKHGDDPQPNREYQTRLSYAREFVADGELVYAEYLIRPLRHADRSKIANLVLLDRLFEILDSELGDTRLEDFEPAPELINGKIPTDLKSNRPICSPSLKTKACSMSHRPTCETATGRNWSIGSRRSAAQLLSVRPPQRVKLIDLVIFQCGKLTSMNCGPCLLYPSFS